LQQHGSWKNHPCRFDVIAYDGPTTRCEPVWIRAAFE
jgi:Holliday junction resolvase-like predicted endonuclease